MEFVSVSPVDQTRVKLVGTGAALRELSDYLTFKSPKADFDPRFRKGHWDGLIRLVDLRKKTVYAGLLPRIKAFTEERGYGFEYSGEPVGSQRVTVEGINSFIDSLGVPPEYERRGYQISAFQKALAHSRCLFLSPTSSGKSFVIYLLCRWYNLKTLIVVPRTGLVHQMANDFVEYGCDEERIHKIQDGKEDITRQITITTWQSVYELPQSWFDQFDVVIGDEAHLFTADSLVGIMMKLTRARYRFGCTGTLDGSVIHQLILEGLFGPTEVVTTTKALMDAGYVAKLKIEIVILNHSKKGKEELAARTREALAKNGKKQRKGAIFYSTEMAFIAECEARNNFLNRLVMKLEGNNLLLFHRVEHGDRLFDLAHETGTGRPIHLINGGTDGLEREEIRSLVDSSDDALLLASVGTTSTGISIRRINNVIMGSPWKSRIINLQTIGRGLRKASDKESVVVYDIADNLSLQPGHYNHTYKHLLERVKTYEEEGFEYRIHKVDLPY